MNHRIFKYELPRASRFSLTMPRGAQILSVGVQSSTSCLWALVDEQERPEERIFRIVATGETFDAGRLRFIGHIRHPDAPFEFFVWEVDMGLEQLIPDTIGDRYSLEQQWIDRGGGPKMPRELVAA